MRRLRPAWAVAVMVAIAVAAPMAKARPADASPARINGSGSTYAALAMQQWVADAQTSGLAVNYLPTGSPAGLTQFAQNLIDFAGTEAEYSALGNSDALRGYQYVPDVAGAVAIMYNAVDKAGRKVDYLHLSRHTVARIFMGDIARWSDPAITADNKGFQLPDQPITVVYRAGQSGTTALFYDFVQHTEPDLFARWAAKHQLPTTVRIIQLDSAPDFAPKTLALNGSDQIAQSVASPGGLWEVAYDEFGYAKTYHAASAWIDNGSGNWVQPFAQNISAALESARLRPDLSQELSGVYASANPDAYPISAYSYMVTQCAPAGDRPTCKGAYANTGVTETLAKWMRYIACEGQVNMARIGYSPLPVNLSQELVNSIGRMKGAPPEQLTASNCVNPRFKGSLGAGAASPKDPLANKTSTAGGAGAGASGGGLGAAAGQTGSASSNGAGAGGTGGATGAQGTPGALDANGAIVPGAGQLGDNASAVGGGSAAWRQAAPVVYNRPGGAGGSVRPLILFAALLLLPLVVFWLRRLP